MYTIGYSRGEESVTCLPDGRISIRTRWRRGITSPSETRILVIQNLENWLAELLQSFLNSFPQKYLKENPSNLLLYCKQRWKDIHYWLLTIVQEIFRSYSVGCEQNETIGLNHLCTVELIEKWTIEFPIVVVGAFLIYCFELHSWFVCKTSNSCVKIVGLETHLSLFSKTLEKL